MLFEIGAINSAINIAEKIVKWGTAFFKKPPPPQTESVSTRFIRLFESHGVHRNQIPRFFGYGLTLKDVQDDASLIVKLNEEMLDAACERFAVRREWLDGAESQIHPFHDFYKNPKKFKAFIDSLKANTPDGNLQGVLVAPSDKAFHIEALIILQETIGHIGEKEIYRLHLCNNWPFSYWKARAFLTSCVAIAWKEKVYIHGVRKPKSMIEKIAYGETLLGWNGDGIWHFGSVDWYPEDMALKPNEFLDGIDPERDSFGIKSGLKLWLDLDSEGLMDTGIRTGTRTLFEQELEKFTPANRVKI